MNELKFLEEQGVDEGLIRKVEEFRRTYETPAEASHRIVKPAIPFTEKRFWKWQLPGF